MNCTKQWLIYFLKAGTTLWILDIQTELDTLILTKGVHITCQNFVFTYNVHLKESMRP
jgi:hypothetical protein